MILWTIDKIILLDANRRLAILFELQASHTNKVDKVNNR